jgi:hypothetical protein
MKLFKIIHTLWLFNIAMENGPFIDDVPINTSIYKGFSMAMLNNQMVFLMDPDLHQPQGTALQSASCWDHSRPFWDRTRAPPRNAARRRENTPRPCDAGREDRTKAMTMG